MEYLLCLFILCVIGFQVALIFGAPWGRLTQGGRFEGALPLAGRILAALSIVLMAAIALAMLSAAGHWPDWPLWTAWAATATLGISTLMNWITPSPAERKLWGPVTTMMLILAMSVMF